MEQVLENATLFINILGMSRTSSLQQWDFEELMRAFSWADYFQQVYSKLESREKQRDLLDKELMKQSCREKAQLGLSVLRFEDLKHAKSILSRNILQNIWCPPELYSETMKLSYTNQDSSLTESNKSEDSFFNHVRAMTKACQCSNLLRPIGVDLVKSRAAQRHLQETDRPEDSLDYAAEFSQRVNTRLLRNVISKWANGVNTEAEFFNMLEVFASRNGSIQLLEFMSNEVSEGNPKLLPLIVKFFKERLIPAWRKDHGKFLELPASSIVSVVIQADDLFKDYFRLLFECCVAYDKEDSMQQAHTILRIKGVQDMACATLQKLEVHFLKIRDRSDVLLRFKGERSLLPETIHIDLCYRTSWDHFSKRYLTCLVSIQN